MDLDDDLCYNKIYLYNMLLGNLNSPFSVYYKKNNITVFNIEDVQSLNQQLNHLPRVTVVTMI